MNSSSANQSALKHTQKQVKITRFNGFPGISRVFQHTAWLFEIQIKVAVGKAALD